MLQGKKIVVLGAGNAGKSSAVCDGLFGTRLRNLVRVEIEARNVGSVKPGVLKIGASDIDQLVEAMLNLEPTYNLLCDVGYSQYQDFEVAAHQDDNVTRLFDRFVIVINAGMSVREDDAIQSFNELVAFGAAPEKLSIIFNKAPFKIGAQAIQDDLRKRFRRIFRAAEEQGLHVCPTPIVEFPDLYRQVFQSPDFTIEDLVAGKHLEKIEELTGSGAAVPEDLKALLLVDGKARRSAKPNLDQVWSEMLAVLQPDHAQATPVEA